MVAANVHKHISTASVWMPVLMCLLFCLMSCDRDEDKPRVDAVTDRASAPLLLTDTVSTLISDSGITRYRINTPRWLIFDKSDPPYWEFPFGVYIERFNPDLETEASLKADYAYYDEREQLWRLDGNVEVMNLEGEHFETEQLFWSQKKERVYSDSAIKITRETSIITGIGFESNQQMTKYTIKKPQGVFPIKDEENENAQ